MSTKEILERQIRELERNIAEAGDERDGLVRRLNELKAQRHVENVNETHSQLLKG